MNLDELRRDVAAFADAGTEVEVGRSEGGVSLSWLVRGKRAELRPEDDGSFSMGGSTYRTYGHLLASAEMADLTGIARAIVATVTAEAAYLDPDAHADLPSGDYVEGPALNLIERLVAEDQDGRTRLVFVTADAGSGKTTALRELVRRQAVEYLRGESTHLYLYINAQGRALARFNEAMAVELQDLRTSLTYHAVAPLVREGILVPVVDGFDELIGTQGGYDDAFSSLSLFLEQLDGRGSLVAAARSAYYEQEFLSRANARSASGAQSWTQWPVRLHRWTADQVRRYAASVLGNEALVENVQEVFAPDSVSELRGRPLFVNRVVDLVKGGGIEIGEEQHLLDSLIDSYLRREQGAKLLSRTERPLLESAALREYYTELAMEMWRQETRQLSRASLREIAELFASLIGLDDDDQRIFIERAPTLAFMASSGPSGAIEFEHETFLLYFLASRVASIWDNEEPTALSQLLSKSDVTDELADYVVERFSGDGAATARRIVQLQRVLDGAFLRRDQIAENCGSLLGALVRRHGCEPGTRLDGFEFAGVSLAGAEVSGVHLVNCRFRRCDLRGARFHHCSAAGVVLDEPAIGQDSLLDVAGLAWDRDVVGLRWSSQDEATQLIFDPSELRRRLASVGLPSAIDAVEHDHEWLIDPDVLEILSGLARAYGRANPVCEADRWIEPFVQRPGWRVLTRAMVEAGVATEETRSARGSRKRFFRCQVVPQELLAGRLMSANVDPRVRELWSILASQAGAP